MNFRIYLAGTIFWVLLIWGPVDHSRPFGLAIRTVYLILIPVFVWFLISWIWSRWRPNNKLESILERILSGLICIAIFIFAFFEAISKTHTENTQQIQTRDGMEDVGEYVVVQGTDWGSVLFLIVIALLVLWYGVLRKGTKTSEF